MGISPLLSLAKYCLPLRLAGMAAEFYNDDTARRRCYYSDQQHQRAARGSGGMQQSSGTLQVMMKDIAIYHFFVEGKTHPFPHRYFHCTYTNIFLFFFLSLFRVSYYIIRDAGKHVRR